MTSINFSLKAAKSPVVPEYSRDYLFSGKTKITNVEKLTNNNVTKLKNHINEWLGKNTKMIKNKHGDPIFLSKDGTRRIRFDFNNSHGDRQHLHIEQKSNNRWRDATNQHRIYPLEENHSK